MDLIQNKMGCHHYMHSSRLALVNMGLTVGLA